MVLLIFGLILFISIHLIPAFPKLRKNLIGKLKPSGYKAVFNSASLISIVLIVFGLKQVPFEALYDPPSWGRHLNMLMMFVAIYLFASNTKGSSPSSVKVFSAHPISWGVIVWAIGHLFANGDKAHVILFCSFLVYSVISIISGNMRGLKPVLTERPPFKLEVVFIVVIILVYSLLFWTHGYYTGMPLI